MPANVNPIFTLTPNIGTGLITTTYAQPRSDGSSAGSANDRMVRCFTAGNNGSYVDKARFWAVATTAATNSNATTARVYMSSVSSPETTATTSGNTFLLGEISMPIISAGHSLNASNYYDLNLSIAIPSGRYLLASQHLAQAASQNILVTVFGGDY